jgi:hypothetical protein
MIDDLDEINRRIAYIDHLRGLHRFERVVGLVMILASAGILLTSRFVLSLPHILVLAGYAFLAGGWVVWLWVIWQRTAWRRANPFETWRP